MTYRRKAMTIDEQQRVVLAINNLLYLVEVFYPDPVYAEQYHVDEVIDQGRKALTILTKEGE
jgi:hypothetical protein